MANKISKQENRRLKKKTGDSGEYNAENSRVVLQRERWSDIFRWSISKGLSEDLKYNQRREG